MSQVISSCDHGGLTGLLFFELEDGEIISRKMIENAINGGEAYRIWKGHKKVGGAVIRTDGAHGELELLFTAPQAHSKGIGYAAWQTIEKLHPEVTLWETVTPCFETRNIHFYVNRCFFRIVEFFNRFHPDPNEPDGCDKDAADGMDGMFRFEKKES